jgi:hypothetical protein
MEWKVKSPQYILLDAVLGLAKIDVAKMVLRRVSKNG